MTTPPLQIAIDGPAGSGKSTIAARLARELGFVHVDTGAMYRALAWIARRDGIDPGDGAGLEAALRTARLTFAVDGRLRVDDDDVSEAIRTPEVTAIVSQVAAHRAVRAEMVRRQQALCRAAERGAVMEGRDIGSVVLPLAGLKIHLTASVQERARRRAAQMGAGAEELPGIQADIERRDELDSTREESPLLVSPDAHVLDTTELDADAVVARGVELAAAAARPRRDQPHEVRFPTPRYRFFQPKVRAVFRGLFGLRIRGFGVDAGEGSVLYACNHISWWDPLVAGSSLSREVWFLAKKELFWGPFGRLISAFNAIPIVRGRFDAKAFDRATALLEADANVLIFPEGTRRKPGHPGPVKKGLGLLAMRSGRPYHPVHVRGTTALGRCFLRQTPLEVRIGPPITLHALDHLRATLPESEIQARVGQLCLAQFRALAEDPE